MNINPNLLIVVIYNLLILVAASWLIVDLGLSFWWYAITYLFLLDTDKANQMVTEDEE